MAVLLDAVCKSWSTVPEDANILNPLYATCVLCRQLAMLQVETLQGVLHGAAMCQAIRQVAFKDLCIQLASLGDLHGHAYDMGFIGSAERPTTTDAGSPGHRSEGASHLAARLGHTAAALRGQNVRMHNLCLALYRYVSFGF